MKTSRRPAGAVEEDCAGERARSGGSRVVATTEGEGSATRARGEGRREERYRVSRRVSVLCAPEESAHHADVGEAAGCGSERGRRASEHAGRRGGWFELEADGAGVGAEARVVAAAAGRSGGGGGRTRARTSALNEAEQEPGSSSQPAASDQFPTACRTAGSLPLGSRLPALSLARTRMHTKEEHIETFRFLRRLHNERESRVGLRGGRGEERERRDAHDPLRASPQPTRKRPTRSQPTRRRPGRRRPPWPPRAPRRGPRTRAAPRSRG